MYRKYLLLPCFIALLSPFGWAQDNCEFDVDDADSPLFMDKIVDCEQPPERTARQPEMVEHRQQPVTRLYGDGSTDGSSGISERVVVAPGSLNHSAGKRYEVRELYSLRPDAPFEQSVALVIHRLHLQMAHYCARGWVIERQWSVASHGREGDYFLHYGFRCSS